MQYRENIKTQFEQKITEQDIIKLDYIKYDLHRVQILISSLELIFVTPLFLRVLYLYVSHSTPLTSFLLHPPIFPPMVF